MKKSSFEWFEIALGICNGMFFILIGCKYISSYIPSIKIIGTWLYLFHFAVAILVILQGMKWVFDSLDKIKKKK